MFQIQMKTIVKSIAQRFKAAGPGPFNLQQLIAKDNKLFGNDVRKSFSTAQRPPIKAVIFDFDGIIVDSETIFYNVNSTTLAHWNVKYTLELKHGQMGRKLTEAVDFVLKQTGLAEKGVIREQYLEIYERIVDKMLPYCEETAGARRLIEHLNKHGVQQAICTGSASDEFPKKLNACQDLIKHMNAIVLAGDDPDVQTGKPAPDAYIVTMRRMKPSPLSDPTSVLVFEDSINGVKSALAAGCRAIWIPQKEFLGDDWQQHLEQFKKHEGFAEKLNSLEEFRPEQYGLPAFK